MGGRPKINGPPKATLSRRSQSYSDFHDAVRTVLGGIVGKSQDRHQQQFNEKKEITTELDFLDWYNELEPGLLDASHDEYKLVEIPLLPRGPFFMAFSAKSIRFQILRKSIGAVKISLRLPVGRDIFNVKSFNFLIRLLQDSTIPDHGLSEAMRGAVAGAEADDRSSQRAGEEFKILYIS